MSKSTGIVRKIDELGRVVIPKEMRNVYGIAEGDPLEVYSGDNGEIILVKYVPACSCIFCGNEAKAEYKNKRVCAACIQELLEIC